MASMLATLRAIQRLPHEKYVLHGSRHRLDVIEPRLARGSRRHEWQNRRAVYATIYPPIAIIRAVIHENGNPRSRMNWKFPPVRRDGPIQVTGRDLQYGPGYVYVLPRDSFEMVHLIYALAYTPVIPVGVFRLSPMILHLFPPTEIRFPRLPRL